MGLSKAIGIFMGLSCRMLRDSEVVMVAVARGFDKGLWIYCTGTGNGLFPAKIQSKWFYGSKSLKKEIEK
jgi:hypothetical protein